MEYISPQGVLLLRVYSTAASPLWLELRGLSAWQATRSWTVYQLACWRLLPWLQVMFAVVPDAALPGSDQRPWGTAPAAGPVGRLGRLSAPDTWGVVCCFNVTQPPYVHGVLGLPAPVHRCARSVHCVTCAVSLATWLLFSLCSLGALCCVCGALDHLAPVHRCPRPLRCVLCVVSYATWLLCRGVPARCVVLRVRCLGPPASCSPLPTLGVLAGVSGVMGHLTPVHQCAPSVWCLARAVSWATWLLITSVPARCVVLRARCPGLLGSCSPVCGPFMLCGMCGVLGQCARSACCVAFAASWATWLLFTGVLARCVELRVRCPGPLGSCSPVCTLGVLCCVCGVLGHLAPGHRCARSVRCVGCVVSWATWLLFTCVLARACCVALASPWATWLLFIGVLAQHVVLPVRRPGPLMSRSPMCPLGALCCMFGVLGHWAPVHGCAHSVCCVACAVSWATWLLFTGLYARCVALHVRWPGPLGSCSRVCSRGMLCCVCGVLGHLAPVNLVVRLVCCVACAVSWTTWLLFAGVQTQCVVLCVRCPGPLGSCARMCPLGALRCV